MARSKASVKDRRRVEVDLKDTFSLREFDGYTLDEGIAFLQRAKERHANKVVAIKVQGVPYDDYDEYTLCERRLETDEELAQRLGKEAQWAAEQEARDRVQYEALSKRFAKTD
jgi:hypothetical protein